MSGPALGVARIVEIDTSTGALFGSISKESKEPRFLEPKEVVLTFDDGPVPPITKSILDTLDRFCTKATFFSVGKMALAYPSTVKNIIARGHTIGSHTWSHPLSLRRLSSDKANEEIEKGHAAVTLAAGEPVAPFFRFPGLSDNAAMLRHLQGRGIASFSVDSVSNDSYISDPDRLLEHALKEIDDHKGGIVLFHDIKPATARILPKFLSELQARGYRIVHMRPRGSVTPLAGYTEKLAPLLAKSQKSASAPPALVPFYGLARPAGMDDDGAGGDQRATVATAAGLAIGAPEPLPVTALAPAVRNRPDPVKASDSVKAPATSKSTAVASGPERGPATTAVRGWTARSDQPGLANSITAQPARDVASPWGAKVTPAR